MHCVTVSLIHKVLSPWAFSGFGNYQTLAKALEALQWHLTIPFYLALLLWEEPSLVFRQSGTEFLWPISAKINAGSNASGQLVWEGKEKKVSIHTESSWVTLTWQNLYSLLVHVSIHENLLDKKLERDLNIHAIMTKFTSNVRVSFIKLMFCCKRVFAKWEKKAKLLQASTQFRTSEMFLSRLLLLSTFSNLLKGSETEQTGLYYWQTQKLDCSCASVWIT